MYQLVSTFPFPLDHQGQGPLKDLLRGMVPLAWVPKFEELEGAHMGVCTSRQIEAVLGMAFEV